VCWLAAALLRLNGRCRGNRSFSLSVYGMIITRRTVVRPPANGPFVYCFLIVPCRVMFRVGPFTYLAD
jgi:hypothetical protein